MTLSKREQEILRRLELELDSQEPAWWRFRTLRFSRWSDWVGGALLASGLVLVLVLLPISVAASFAAFAVSMLGLGQLLTGRSADRLADAIRRAGARSRSQTKTKPRDGESGE